MAKHHRLLSLLRLVLLLLLLLVQADLLSRSISMSTAIPPPKTPLFLWTRIHRSTRTKNQMLPSTEWRPKACSRPRRIQIQTPIQTRMYMRMVTTP